MPLKSQEFNDCDKNKLMCAIRVDGTKTEYSTLNKNTPVTFDTLLLWLPDDRTLNHPVYFCNDKDFPEKDH